MSGVVVEHCALGSLAEVWAWAGARLMTAGVRVELAEGLVRRVEAGGGRVWRIWI